LVEGRLVERRVIQPQNYLSDHSDIAPRKDRILPESWIDRADEIVLEEYMGANRYFAQHDQGIKRAVKKLTGKEPVVFYSELVNQWEDHHRFYEGYLEPNLDRILPIDTKSLSGERIALINEIYAACSSVDLTTLAYSAGIKPFIDEWMDIVAIEQGTTIQGLLTDKLRVGSYHVDVTADHMQYLMLEHEDPQAAEAFKEKLVQHYHGGSNAIFSSRLNKYREKYGDKTPDELKQKIKALRPINKLRGLPRKSRIGALAEILEFDNKEEYLIASNFEGTSGLIFRQRLMRMLIDEGLLDGEPGIYDIDQEQIDEKLKELKAQRVNQFEFSVRPIRQTTDNCAATCGMMVLDYLQDQSGGSLDEFTESSSTKSYTGNHFSAIADYLLEQADIDVVVHHSLKERFVKGFLEKGLFDELMAEYDQHMKNAKLKGAKEINGVDPDTKFIRNQLSEGRLVILAGQLSQYVLHAVLVTGIDGDGFTVIDPLTGTKKVWSELQVDRFRKTDIGNWAITACINGESLSDLAKNAKLHNYRSKERFDSLSVTNTIERRNG